MTRINSALALLVVAVYAPEGWARQTHQKTFSSPQEAIDALVVAVEAGDENGLSDLFAGNEQIFAPDGNLGRQRFLEKFRQMHRLAFEPEGRVLYIGAENWPFPVPLTSNAGAWSFDTEAGLDEILFRRIGANESSAIAICDALARSGDETAGFLANAVPIAGYWFRALRVQGKPASFLAYPAQYGSSGVMTFVVDHHVVYERDLGPGTVGAAKAMTRTKLDSSWSAVQ